MVQPQRPERPDAVPPVDLAGRDVAVDVDADGDPGDDQLPVARQRSLVGVAG